MLERPEVLLNYRGAYGRLCTLAALGLHAGNSREAVQAAFLGEGENIHLTELRAARYAANEIFAKVREVVDIRDCIKVAREARDAVEQEWNVRLPIISPLP